MFLRSLLILILFALVACDGTKTITTVTVGNDISAEAVADVDAAMTEVQNAESPPAAPVPAK